VSMQDRCTFCTKCTIGSEIILDAPDGTSRRGGSSESSVRLEIVLILTQDRCTIYVERTICLEVTFWTHPMELLGDVRHMESLFFLFGDSVSVSPR
jgi:hypothetical protein